MNHAHRRILAFDLMKLLRDTRMTVYDISAELDISCDTARAWCAEGEQQGIFERGKGEGNLAVYTLAKRWIG